MAWLTIEGVKPYDGRYEFTVDISQFTTREWGWIKRHSGYLPFTFNEGFEGGDPDLFAVFTAIALVRAGKVDQTDVPTVLDRFADVPPFSTFIKYEVDEAEEDDAGPPPSSSSSSNGSSGDDTKPSSATSDATPSAAGTDASATSALPHTRLVT